MCTYRKRQIAICTKPDLRQANEREQTRMNNLLQWIRMAPPILLNEASYSLAFCSRSFAFVRILLNTRCGTDSLCINNPSKTYHLTHWFVLSACQAALAETDVVPLVSRKHAFLRELIIRRVRLPFVSDNRISSARHRARCSQRGRDRVPTLVY